eukprot:3967754-Amphidinium_carterae.3
MMGMIQGIYTCCAATSLAHPPFPHKSHDIVAKNMDNSGWDAIDPPKWVFFQGVSRVSSLQSNSICERTLC